MPTTASEESSSGPPESPAWMAASVSISPVRCSGLLPSESLAVMLRSTAVTVPGAALGVPPVPPALPTPVTASPVDTADELVFTVARPEASTSWTTATSVVVLMPTTFAASAAVQERDRLREGEVGEHGVVPGADVTHERVLAAGIHVELDVRQPRRVQRGHDVEPRVRRHVRGLRPDHDHRAPAYAGGLRERRGIVRPQVPVLQAGRVEADRRRDPGVQCGTEGQVTPEAEPGGEDLPHVVAALQVVEH